MNYKRLWLVLQREYSSIVAKKSFIIITILMPLILVAFGGVPVLMSYINQSEIETVAVIDQTGRYSSALHDTDDYHFSVVDNVDPADTKGYYDKADGGVYAIVVIPADADSTASINVYSETPVRMSLLSHLENDLNDAMTQHRLNSYGIPELKTIIENSEVHVNVRSHTWDENGQESLSSSGLAAAIGIVLSMLTYFFVLMYGAMIMSSVIEDKTNRIVEVVVSSCKPMELMLGKVLGVGLVGITQIAVWTVLISVISGLFGIGMGVGSFVAGQPAEAMSAAQEMPSEIAEIWQAITGINWVQLIGVFVLYFIGGYLLYASLFAAFGSAVDQQSDASQFTTPVMMIIILAFFIGQGCMDNPNGQLGVVCSMIPFTSPIVMMVRLPYDVPAWQVIISIALLYATALLFVYFAARIYRTGILMYGRKVSIGEILKWIRK